MEVTLISREKIRGIKRRPTVNDDAFKNSPLLNAGSSAMTMFSAVAPPRKMDASSFPIWTGRLSAAESFFSSSGRKLSTLMSSGAATAATTSTATTIPATINNRFMGKMLSETKLCKCHN
jgi:hypothetical protein